MTVGERIKERREELGMTQEELAKTLGYRSRSSINKMEVGERDIPRKMIVDISKVLRVSPSYLMGWTEDKQYGLMEMAEVLVGERELQPTPHQAKLDRLLFYAEMITDDNQLDALINVAKGLSGVDE